MFEKITTIKKEYRYFKIKTIERNCFDTQDYITNVYKMFDRERIECIIHTVLTKQIKWLRKTKQKGTK